MYPSEISCSSFDRISGGHRGGPIDPYQKQRVSQGHNAKKELIAYFIINSKKKAERKGMYPVSTLH